MRTLSAWEYEYNYIYTICYHLIRLLLGKIFSKAWLNWWLASLPSIARKKETIKSESCHVSESWRVYRAKCDALIEPRFCVSTELFPFWHTRPNRLRRVLNRDRLLVNVGSVILYVFFTIMSFRHKLERGRIRLNTARFTALV